MTGEEVGSLAEAIDTFTEQIGQGVLFTLEGCPACDMLKDYLKEAIQEGEVEVRKCDIDGSPEEQKHCEDAIEKPDFEGFPVLYSKDGLKIM